MPEIADYALRFIGVHYKWGGSNPMEGFDCSGFVQECLKSVGLDPEGDQTAQSLYDEFMKRPHFETTQPGAGALAFYGKSVKELTHVAICLDSKRVIEAGGGGRTTVNKDVAASQSAFVRVRPLRHRLDLQAIIYPSA